MYSTETMIRVRYGETDQMGIAYYGNYPEWLEVGRTEMIRSLGVSYKEMEEKGILLPVYEVHIKYLSPALYDEEICIRTSIREMPRVRIKFEYELFNSQKTLISTAETTLIFVRKEGMKPTQAPEYFLNKLKPFFNLESI